MVEEDTAVSAFGTTCSCRARQSPDVQASDAGLRKVSATRATSANSACAGSDEQHRRGWTMIEFLRRARVSDTIEHLPHTEVSFGLSQQSINYGADRLR